jgi:hypothetical protein
MEGDLMVSTHTLFEWLVGLHIATGTVGLVVVWIPIAGKKGGMLHRRAGTLFVQSMIATGFTAVASASPHCLTPQALTRIWLAPDLCGPAGHYQYLWLDDALPRYPDGQPRLAGLAQHAQWSRSPAQSRLA